MSVFFGGVFSGREIHHRFSWCAVVCRLPLGTFLPTLLPCSVPAPTLPTFCVMQHPGGRFRAGNENVKGMKYVDRHRGEHGAKLSGGPRWHTCTDIHGPRLTAEQVTQSGNPALHPKSTTAFSRSFHPYQNRLPHTFLFVMWTAPPEPGGWNGGTRDTVDSGRRH